MRSFCGSGRRPRPDSGPLNPRGTRGCPEQNRRRRGQGLSLQYGGNNSRLRRIMELRVDFSPRAGTNSSSWVCAARGIGLAGGRGE